MHFRQSSAPHSAYHDERPRNPSLKSPTLGVYRDHNLRISRRTCLDQDTITLQGWPSRGGIIVMENATPPDFNFLRLDSLDPPLRRDFDQIAEAAFCQALLRLGATWWDSEARRDFVRKIENGDGEAFDPLNADENLAHTCRECGWVRIAWPLQPSGALCVLSRDKVVVRRSADITLRPRHYGVVSLARTMDERYTLLQRLMGIVYARIDDYQGQLCSRRGRRITRERKACWSSRIS